MGSQTFTEALTADIKDTSNLGRFVGSQFSGLKANGLLFDVIMTCDGEDKALDHVSDLKEIYVNCNLRRRDADALQLLSNVRLYDVMAYSDYNAGVSTTLAMIQHQAGDQSQAAGKTTVELSGYLNFGFFSIGLDESVELLITGRPVREKFGEIQILSRWVYLADMSQRVFGYRSFKSSGGEQAYRDVQGIFYIGAAVEKNATIRDYTGSQSVNLRDSVAFANATGRFEIFTDFGLLYNDPTGLSQDLAISLEDGHDIFMLQEFFSFGKLVEGDGKIIREQEAVLQNIYAQRKEKFDVLRQKGLVPAGFTPAIV